MDDQSFQAAAAIVFLAWLATCALLQLEHALWKAIDFRLRYLLGMGTVCLGCLGAGVALDSVALAIVPGVLATSGLTVLLSYASEAKAERDKVAAQRRGEVVGMALGVRKTLSQETIDRGDDPTHN